VAARGFYRARPRRWRVWSDPIKSARASSDAGEQMLVPVQPKSNTERQRLFRKRNPGYYGRLHARRRSGIKHDLAAAELAAAQQAMAAQREPLMLPAPAVTVEIPGMTTIPATAAIPALAPLPVSQQATPLSLVAKSLAA
jgi:hypothetical protein